MLTLHKNSWRDPQREIDAACAILDLLPRRVAHRITLEVWVMSCGQLCAVATLCDRGRRIDYGQGMLSDADFPIFAARHIVQWVEARPAAKAA